MFNRNLKIVFLYVAISIVTGFFSLAGAVTIADYSAYPPFLPRVVRPNILFMIDYSKHMVRPAYGECSFGDCQTRFTTLSDSYNPNADYEGYFDPRADVADGFKYYYKTTSPDPDTFFKSSTGDWDGNWLNWLTMTQFDVVKTATIGGNIDTSPEQANPSGLTNLTKTIDGRTFYKLVNTSNCVANALDSLCVDFNEPLVISTDMDDWVEYGSGDTRTDIINDIVTFDGSSGDGSINIPFDFEFLGKVFTENTRLYVTSDGLMTFTPLTDAGPYRENSNTPSDGTDTPYNSAMTGLDALMAVFWDDASGVLSQGSKIYSFTKGTAENRLFVVRFENLLVDTDAAKNNPITYQAVFVEGQNLLLFQYKSVQTTQDNFGGGRGASVLIKNSSTGKRAEYLDNQTENTSVLIQDGTTLLMAAPDKTLLEVTPGVTTTKFKRHRDSTEYEVKVEIQNTGPGPVCNETNGEYKNTHEKNGKCYDHPVGGLIQYFRDNKLTGDLGFRLAVMMINRADGDGGFMRKHIQEFESTPAQWSSISGDIRNQVPVDDAPLAEALFDMQGYIRQDGSYEIGDIDTTFLSKDPYYFLDTTQMVPCAKSSVLLLSSGHYSNDNGTSIFTDDLPSTNYSASAVGDTDVSVNWTTGAKMNVETDAWSAAKAAVEGMKSKGGWLDNVAYQMRSTDLRSDAALGGSQTASLYVVDSYGEGNSPGSAVLKRAAHFGGYKKSLDLDDINDPYTYYSPLDGSGGVKGSVLRAIYDILRNSSSGTSVSVLSTSAGGEGAIYQAYFYPARVLNQIEERQWPGFMRAFFIDRYQNIRDDHSAASPTDTSAPNAKLELARDRVVEMYLDDSDSAVRIKARHDADGDGLLEAAEQTPVTFGSGYNSVSMDDIASLWEGGERLAKQHKDERNVYTWIDDGSSATEVDFSLTNATETLRLGTQYNSLLAPYLRAEATNTATATLVSRITDSTNIINFILGKSVYNSAAVTGDYQNFRNRCIYVTAETGVGNEPGCADDPLIPTSDGYVSRVWPLGDIVFSTPTLVTAPSENYHKIYGDPSYLAFRRDYVDRRNMVYVGANDGMLHAFNAGFYHEGDDSDDGVDVQGYFTDGTEVAATATDFNYGVALGEETWAFLPPDLLPHMVWLTCNGTPNAAGACDSSEYTHVYYVDSRAKVTDVRMFEYNDGDAGLSLDYSGIDGQAGVEHTQGWGTILILSMRLGGGAMDVTADFDYNPATTDTVKQFRSAYYALDITDPEKPPKLLWRFTDPQLGFSTSYPAIVRSKDDAANIDEWFMVVGSGPENLVPTGLRDYNFNATTKKGQVYAVKLKDGTYTKLDPGGTIFENNQIMGDPSVIDVDGDFSSDVIYIGSLINSTPGSASTNFEHGKVYRINTKKKDTPVDWAVSEFFDPDPSNSAPDPTLLEEIGPVLVGPSASKDSAGNIWIYFGTGQLKNTDDNKNSDGQAFFAIKEECWDGAVVGACTTTYSKDGDGSAANKGLLNTSAIVVKQLSATVAADEQLVDPDNTVCADSSGLCNFSEVKTAVTNKQGWYITLDNPATASERVLSKSSVLGGLVLFTTYTPVADTCSIFGNSKLYAVYYETGTAFNRSVVGVDSTTGEIFRSIDIGEGMPTSVGVAIGETVSGFIQKSTGEIITIESEPALKVKSGPSSWYGGAAGCGTTGIETIYKHIAK
ncbi:MAG: hypothetical protein P1P74_08440 [Desulfuromonadales bacterium]|nr:hypothetical protein [Desulfuromonadales bacterium]